jgi:hypothetical protein
MDKVVIEEIKKGKRKKWEDNWAKRKKKLGIIIDVTVIKITKMFVKAKLTITWTLIVVKEVGDRFHQNFQIGL